MRYTTKKKTKNQKQKKECACVHTCVQTGERGETERAQAPQKVHIQGKANERAGPMLDGKQKKKTKNENKKNRTKKKTKAKTKKARACVHTEERVETEHAQAP